MVLASAPFVDTFQIMSETVDSELEAIRGFRRIHPWLGTSGQPSAVQFQAIRASGFQVVINLALPTSDHAIPEEGSLVTTLGMAYYHIPVSFDCPQSADFDAFRRLMRGLGGMKVWVHCAANFRVASFVFLYRVLEDGISEREAESDLKAVWEPDAIWKAFIDEQRARCSRFVLNSSGQPIGRAVQDWTAPPRPGRDPIVGRQVMLEPLDAVRDAESLWQALCVEGSDENWTYLFYGPFQDRGSFDKWLAVQQELDDPLFVVLRPVGLAGAAGLASWMRIQPEQGCIEIGHLNFGPQLKRSTAATEAMFLMIDLVFQLGYRRCEWKCDALNYPSRRAAIRLGFVAEGVFRNALVYKGRSRDTAWFSIVEEEWPRLRSAYLEWMQDSNFDGAGRQRSPLAAGVGARRA